MIRDDEASYGVSYWPSVSDLFMTLFITAVALIGVVLFVFLPGKPTTGPFSTIEECNRRFIELEGAFAQCQGQLRQSAAEILKIRQELDDARHRASEAEKQLQDSMRQEKELERRLADCEKRCGTPPENPDCRTPIIPISPGSNFFPLGRASVSVAFASDLNQGAFNTAAKEIIRRNQTDGLSVDTLEVIGHTDGMPFNEKGNLDQYLPEALSGQRPIDSLKPGSNNDLGLLRALAIKQAWRNFVTALPEPERAQLESIEVRTYSAGQTLPVDPGHFQAEDPRARRIELRLTKLH